MYVWKKKNPDDEKFERSRKPAVTRTNGGANDRSDPRWIFVQCIEQIEHEPLWRLNCSEAIGSAKHEHHALFGHSNMTCTEVLWHNSFISFVYELNPNFVHKVRKSVFLWFFFHYSENIIWNKRLFSSWCAVDGIFDVSVYVYVYSSSPSFFKMKSSLSGFPKNVPTGKMNLIKMRLAWLCWQRYSILNVRTYVVRFWSSSSRSRTRLSRLLSYVEKWIAVV